VARELYSAFQSPQIWRDLARHFERKESVRRIRAYAGEEREAFFKLVEEFIARHSWTHLERRPSEGQLLRVTRAALALTLGLAGGPKQVRRLSWLKPVLAAGDDEARLRARLALYARFDELATDAEIPLSDPHNVRILVCGLLKLLRARDPSHVERRDASRRTLMGNLSGLAGDERE
jgi:hypothetical protein